MKKLAIIGASYLQEPLIRKAKEMGLETHVFAWECGDIGEKIADFFYPISIIEKDLILEKCKEIKIDGICTIASDLAVITVNYVACAMGLISNSVKCTEVSTNKNSMRRCFERNGDPSPKSILVGSVDDLADIKLHYPIIVKPLDRSGSRGITKLDNKYGLKKAIEHAIEEGFEKKALVEEYATGQEYSIESISWKGTHTLLAITKKYTTGSPAFIETGHLEPADVSDELKGKIEKVVYHALDSLGIEYGASHTELKIDLDEKINIIEIGGRMGGDFIGSNLVEISTGVDFLKAVIQVALGEEPDLSKTHKERIAVVRFVFSENDVETYNRIQQDNPEMIINSDVPEKIEGVITDSSNRLGYYLICANNLSEVQNYLPDDNI